MRVQALAAIAAGLAVLAVAGVAEARPWDHDGEGRLTFNIPSGWQETEEARQTGDLIYAEIYDPEHDCAVVAQPTEGMAAISAARALQAIQQEERFTEDYLLSVGNTFVGVFPNDSAVLVSQSLDTESGFWPIRRVTYMAGEKTVHGAIQWRPGLQLFAVCSIYDGEDRASDYDAFFRSIGTRNDAALQAEAIANPVPEPAAEAETETDE